MVEYLLEGISPRKTHNAIGDAMYSKHDRIEGFDGELLAAIRSEERRREDHIELIPA
jgi:hypothetical protein